MTKPARYHISEIPKRKQYGQATWTAVRNENEREESKHKKARRKRHGNKRQTTNYPTPDDVSGV